MPPLGLSVTVPMGYGVKSEGSEKRRIRELAVQQTIKDGSGGGNVA